MNHCVPDFKPNDDGRANRSSSPEDELVELLWQNGQVVLQSQNQKPLKKSLPQKSPDEPTVRIAQPTSTVATEEAPPYQVFMQEDEMSSWLHYPLDEDFCADLLYPAPSGNYSNCSKVTQIPGMSAAAVPPPRPPIPRPPVLQRVERLDDAQSPAQSNKFHNFMYFSRPKLKPTVKSQPSAVRETTMVDSSDTPAVRRSGKAPISLYGDGGGDEHDRELTTCDLTVTSSSGGSGASGEPVATASLTHDRKRKASKIDDHDFHNNEDAKFESSDTKKQVHGSTSTRRSRASEVHNLSERRRRDRINEKMKALQELIPRCNKSDKASMLDEAIEYLKSLQLQVQMMSMGCGMVPMVFPGVQQYMSPVGMRMGMGMGIDMGLNRPMLPFPHVLSGSSMHRPPAATHLGPRLPMPAFHLPAISSANGQPVQATNQADPSLYSFGIQNPHLQIPSFTDPYQHYMCMQQMQAPLCPSQNQATAQPSTSKGDYNLENQKHG